ncbi:MAG: hypothetical protein M0P75_01590, partial [Candidatus Marinimicrobia bacterium]|nr:hypothetical protein [Candidatus Neomarinimicrobiota bacterium]
MRKIFKFLVAFVLISWTAGPVAFAAQVQATRTDEPIRIDGVLGEDIWQTAIVAPPLIQDEPNEGAEPSQSSEIRILYDERALYVGARLYDS